MSMVVSRYRYSEFYWPGSDGNWHYARYQILKITLVVDYGIERRPTRAAFAQSFIDHSILEIEDTTEVEDQDLHLRQFKEFSKA